MEEYIKNAINDDIIKKACLFYDVIFSNVTFIGGFENLVYEYKKNNKEYILRFVHSSHRSKDQVIAELEFIDYLDQNKASVSTVIHSINNSITEVIMIDSDSYFTISVFEKASGSFVKDEYKESSFAFMFGKNVGQLHRLTKSFIPKHKRYRFDEEDYVALGKKSMPKELNYVFERHDEVLKRINNIEETTNNFGLIHTDLHFRNMFYDGTELTFFDFDDSSYKYFVSDIAIIVFYTFLFWEITEDTINEVKKFLIDFLSGYKEECAINKDELLMLNDFFVLRQCILVMVLYSSNCQNDQRFDRFFKIHLESIKNKKPLLDIDYLFDFL